MNAPLRQLLMDARTAIVQSYPYYDYKIANEGVLRRLNEEINRLAEPQPTLHILKSWPTSFDALKAGKKFYEVRVNDRGYRVGDKLLLRRYKPESKEYTGEAALVRVTAMTQGVFGLPANICVMGVEPVEE